MTKLEESDVVDLFVIGGGINGCGIARDAAGRGLSVTLAEMNDLASATSSASTKLFHGGLRYLEYFEFRLVREALTERETLLRAMPHISWPMRFVLPIQAGMRFDATTPTSRLLARVMPWLKGRRPAWLIRLGLFFYDHLGGRKVLPGTISVDLTRGAEGAPLNDRFEKAFEYSDCWVDDARLVVLNARDAAQRGARIFTRTQVVSATRDKQLWRVETHNTENGSRQVHLARMLINAGGPWVADVLKHKIGIETRDNVRLVRGSHIVVPRLYNHEKCYFFQGTDGRIIFAIPYENEFTLIGTTDADHPNPETTPTCTESEQRYLIDFANRYFSSQITDDDVVWTYSGARPLYNDGASSATAATRDYTLRLDANDGPPLLSVFGGKITTYRRLAESAMNRIAEHLPVGKSAWTAGAPLPGGDFPVDGVEDQISTLRDKAPFLTPAWARRLVRAYGTEAHAVLRHAKSSADLGREFGATLTEAEVIWLMQNEFARTAEDIVWRRSKLGLRLNAEQIAELDQWMAAHRFPAPPAAA